MIKYYVTLDVNCLDAIFIIERMGMVTKILF